MQIIWDKLRVLPEPAVFKSMQSGNPQILWRYAQSHPLIKLTQSSVACLVWSEILNIAARIPDPEESDFPWVQLLPVHQELLDCLFDISGKDRRTEKTPDVDNDKIDHRNRSLTRSLCDCRRKRKTLLKQIKTPSL